jgi:hypothetical protein
MDQKESFTKKILYFIYNSGKGGGRNGKDNKSKVFRRDD